MLPCMDAAQGLKLFYKMVTDIYIPCVFTCSRYFFHKIYLISTNEFMPHLTKKTLICDTTIVQQHTCTWYHRVEVRSTVRS